jgi:transcriptional regulator with XRE-family HTH domain
MSQGYSVRLAWRNSLAYQEHLGVQLGKKCIEANLSVREVAKMLGVSRQTVYNWFCGFYTPQDSSIEPIKNLIATL